MTTQQSSTDLGFVIKTESFNGPLDVLLHLIEKRKLFINDISLSKITDEYIEYVQALDQITLDQNVEFVVVASTLLLIKSKSLLPTLDLTSEEEESIEDLEFRLKLYKRIKELSAHVEQKFGTKIMFEREGGYDDIVLFAPGKQISLESMHMAARELVNALPKFTKKPEVRVRKVISLGDMMGSLLKRVKSAMSMTLSEFTVQHKSERVNVIVGFLAMLELVKQGDIIVRQETRYGEIHMETDDIDTPHYI